MIKLITRVLAVALALVLAAELIPGIAVTGVYAAIIAAIVLGLLNTIIRPILVILTIPINLLTFGLFTFVINAGLFMFAASFIKGFSVSGFLPALLGSVLVSIVTMIVHRLT